MHHMTTSMCQLGSTTFAKMYCKGSTSSASRSSILVSPRYFGVIRISNGGGSSCLVDGRRVFTCRRGANECSRSHSPLLPSLPAFNGAVNCTIMQNTGAGIHAGMSEYCDGVNDGGFGLLLLPGDSKTQPLIPLQHCAATFIIARVAMLRLCYTCNP